MSFLGGGLEAQERTKKTKKREKRKVNPSTPRHKFWGLLRVDPERHFLTPPLKEGLGAAEWVNLFIMIILLCKKPAGILVLACWVEFDQIIFSPMDRSVSVPYALRVDPNNKPRYQLPQ